MSVDPDDIALEALLNQSSEGVGSSKKLAFVPVNTAGVASHRTAVVANSTAKKITISAGERTIEIQNVGSKIIYYGGTGVTSSNGIKLFPNQVKLFANVQDTFSIYVVTDGAETSEYRIVEYS